MSDCKYTNSEEFLNKTIEVKVDRPLGSTHPKHENIVYTLNYGYIPNTLSPDGEELDAYILGIDHPVEKCIGKCFAIIRRINDNDDKLIVVSGNQKFTDEQIREATAFQEQFFKSEIIRP